MRACSGGRGSVRSAAKGHCVAVRSGCQPGLAKVGRGARGAAGDGGLRTGRSLRLCWGAPWSRAGGWLTGPPQV